MEILNNEIQLEKEDTVFVLSDDKRYHAAKVENIMRGYKNAQNKPLAYVKCRFIHAHVQERHHSSGRFTKRDEDDDDCQYVEDDDDDDEDDDVFSSNGDDKSHGSVKRRHRRPHRAIQLVRAEALRKEDVIFVCSENDDAPTSLRKAKIMFSSSNMIYTVETADGEIT